MPGFLADADLGVNPIESARLRRVAAGRSYVDLTSSNPTAHGLIFPPEILRAAADGFWDARRYRPEPHGALPARESIAAYYAARRASAARFDPEHIFLTASTSEAYGLLFALLTEPGDNVLAPRATYPLFEHFAAVHHVELRTYELDEARGWAIDEHSLLDAADARTRAVLLVSPHNPTGMVVRTSIAALDALGLPLICDEVFAEFTRLDAPAPLVAALHPGLPCFTLNGISKMFALPDLKLGWVLMNPPAAAQFGPRFEILNDAYLSANSLTQHMLPHLFAHGMPFLEEMRARFNAHVDLALNTLAAHPAFDVQRPAGGYYLFPRVRGWDDEDALVLQLLERGVLVHPGYYYGLDAERDGAHLMISCLTNPEALTRGIQIISDFSFQISD